MDRGSDSEALHAAVFASDNARNSHSVPLTLPLPINLIEVQVICPPTQVISAPALSNMFGQLQGYVRKLLPTIPVLSYLRCPTAAISTAPLDKPH